MNSKIFIDIETTGLSSGKNEAIEIAAKKCNPDNLYPYSLLQMMVFPDRGIQKEAQAHNHITLEMVEWAAPLEDALTDLFNYIRPGDVILGHNFKDFDIRFLEKHGFKFNNKIIDTLAMAKDVGIPYGERSLEKLAKRFDVPYPDDAHRAAADVELNRKVFKHLWPLVQNELFTERK